MKLYYDNILKPLTDTLFELPKIFHDNVEIIKAQEAVVQEDTDVLIRPLQFEHTKQMEFNAAVLAAENSFLEVWQKISTSGSAEILTTLMRTLQEL